MDKLFHFILKHNKQIILLFFLLSAVSIFAASKVKVNSDLSDYLPEDSDSTVSLRVMENQFDGDIPNAKWMVKGISAIDADKLEEKIEQVQGVKEVSYLSDSNLLDMPIEMLDDSITDSYYKDGNALYTLTLDNDYGVELLDEIRALTDYDSAFSGSFVDSKVAQESSGEEIFKTVAIILVFAVIILLFTLESWLEPFLLLACLGVSVLLNSGSNLALGTISNVTSTAASVLQMAVSVDYFIFILHRYKEYKNEGHDSFEAMQLAMSQSLTSILSSSLTTIIGFAALMFMRYQIGLDMGIVLSKGIFISLVCTFTLFPCVILFFSNSIAKTSHKPLISRAEKLSKISVKICRPLGILFIICIIPCFFLQTKNSYYYGTSHLYKDDTELVEERSEIEEVFGKSNVMVLMVPKGDTKKESELTDSLKEMEDIRSITNYTETFGLFIPDMMIPKEIASLLVSDEYSRFVLTLSADAESDKTFALIDKIKKKTKQYYPEDYHLAGGSVSTYDLKKVISADSIKINLIAVGAIFLVLLASFRSVLIPFILTLSIEGSVWICMTIPYLMGTHVFYIGYLIVSSILLGATVDYAILVTSRYRECDHSKGRKQSALEALETSAVSVFTSGSILALAGLLLKIFCTNQLIAQLGELLSIGTILSVTVVLFILPGFLMLFGKIIRKTNKASAQS